MEDANLIALAVALAVKVKTRKRKRSKWAKNWLLKRSSYSHINLLADLRLEKADWFNYLRMDENTYLELLDKVTPFIKKKNTHLRDSISPHERLIATLRYLATGRNYEDLKFSTIISAQALGQIIPETCSAIYSVLAKEYLKFPQTEEDWITIANKFEATWQFPHCLGAVDGKHVQIVPPPNSGSTYYNYKGTHSLVLMAIANADYEFIMIDFGTNGRISDGGVIENSLFYQKLKANRLKIPLPSKTKDSETILPFVFVGDEAFALRKEFLKPFSQKTLNVERRCFNYRLSRARRIIENVFGILASRFRIFHVAIPLKLANIEKVVMACCALHNFLRRKRREDYIPSLSLDNDDLETGETSLGLRPQDHTLLNLEHGHNRHSSETAKEVREAFVQYFNNEGSVPWQNRFI